MSETSFPWLSLILFLTMAGLTAWAFFFTPKENEGLFIKWFKRTGFWIFFGFWFLGNIFDIASKETEKRELKDERDSLFNVVTRIDTTNSQSRSEGKEASARITDKLESLKPHVDTVKIFKPGKPIMNPCSVSEGISRIISETDSNYTFSIRICNEGQLSAVDLKRTTYYVWENSPIGKLNRFEFESQPMTVGKRGSGSEVLVSEGQLPKLPNVKEYFMYYRLEYEDEYGRKYPIKRMVFHCSPLLRKEIHLANKPNEKRTFDIVRRLGFW